MVTRRSFLKTMSAGGLVIGTQGLPKGLFDQGEITKLTILHTNDMHSRIDPFPMDGGKYQGMGGMAKRATIVKKIRREENNVLLLDSGDIFQGTPYFNFFGGELEFKLMSQMGYDAATLGNHDFDSGIDGLVKQMPYADFPFVISNYDVRGTELEGKTKDYIIKQVGDLKIGIFGIGIELDGLVPPSLYKEVKYLDPIAQAQRVADTLTNEEQCDYVICLSHLGYRYDGNKLSDSVLAAKTSNIDLILGGHTHTFLETFQIKENKVGEAVFVNQAGWAGIMLGRVDVFFENAKKSNCKSCKNLFLS